jgi:Domain of unknown function (DUF4177)
LADVLIDRFVNDAARSVADTASTVGDANVAADPVPWLVVLDIVNNSAVLSEQLAGDRTPPVRARSFIGPTPDRQGDARMGWEYLTLEINPKNSYFALTGSIDAKAMNDRLNELGRDGWEITACFDTNKGMGETQSAFIILKRPLIGARTQTA